MKTKLKLKTISLFCLMVMGYVCFTEIKAADNNQEEAQKGKRLFACCHSGMNFVPDLLDKMAEAAGIKGQQQLGRMSTSGKNIDRFWDTPDAKNDAKKALKTGNVDVLMLATHGSPRVWIEEFAVMALKYNPKTVVTIQEGWLIPDYPYVSIPPEKAHPIAVAKEGEVDHNKPTVEVLEKAHELYFKDMEEYARSVNKKLGVDVVRVVPVGHAILALREKVIAGQVPGIKTQSELFKDHWGHPTESVKVLAAYCHFAVIYQRSPVGMPIHLLKATKNGGGEKLERLLQELAWDAVVKHPMSGVKQADASSH